MSQPSSHIPRHNSSSTPTKRKTNHKPTYNRDFIVKPTLLGAFMRYIYTGILLKPITYRRPCTKTGEFFEAPSVEVMNKVINERLTA